MRFDTHRVSAHLVRELQYYGVEIIDDGGDIIHARMSSGEMARIYFIADPIETYEITGIIKNDTRENAYSLFILWCDLLLPLNGTHYIPHDWMEVLLAVQGEKIYAYDAYGEHFYIFPVYFEGTGYRRFIRYGDAIEAGALTGASVHTHLSYLRGEWRVGSFDRGGRPPDAPASPFAAEYTALGLRDGSSRAAVKLAYRRLARAHHPDLDASPGANERMQRINLAYDQLMRALESEDEDAR